ncbi:cytochrome C peroxidase [Polyangium aurulentum]|uniref:cytochrome C peroxidase n=1 Tax=Polyangium aurulentum TaxID=2567896 RepID=UPI0010AEC052|nr:cytochrome C peroxidase [Polyangium aurulentum]UQA59123.1 cytochrome C peroxidase [Polyangium aurulentum]
MRKSSVVVGLVAAACSLAAGCGGGGAGGPEARTGRAQAAGGCGRMKPGVGAKPIAPMRQGATVALARIGDRTIAYVADEDDANVHTVDVKTGAELGTSKLKGTPSQLLVAPDGRVMVALKDQAAVEVLEPGEDASAPLESRCVVPTPVEPVALATTPDDGAVLVTSGWGAALTAYDTASMTRMYEVPLAREPRAVVVSDDGKKAFVAHVVGSRMSVVDLVAKRASIVDVGGAEVSRGFGRGTLLDLVDDSAVDRRGCQGYALAKSTSVSGRIFAPQVLVDPGRADQRSEGYGSGNGMNPPEVAAIAVIDEDLARPMAESVSVKPSLHQMTGNARPIPQCLLPRAAAVDAASRSLFVACAGIDAVVEYDAGAADPQHAERRRFPVASGPTGIAIDPVGRRAVVWSQFDRTLNVIPLGAPGAESAFGEEPQQTVRVALSREAGTAATADLELGRKLFHMTGDARISSDGRACASCHPDGRDDALTWATPDGPRQTPMLAGRLRETAPYGWMGNGESVKDHLASTFQRLGGVGLSGRELDALVAFATSLRAPATGSAQTEDAVLVERGRAVFHSSETGCASCHSDGNGYTDRSAHDVASRAAADIVPAFDTPSLRFVGGTAPYFHDGRYPTLRAMLVGADGKMGHTKGLSQNDLDALEAYLRSL